MNEMELSKLVKAYNDEFEEKRSKDSIRRKRRDLGYVAKTDGRFVKGQVSPNKGRKMSAETYAKCEKTMFKKNHVPETIKNIGCVSILNGDYWRIKVADVKGQTNTNWKLLHHHVFEKYYGKVPEGYTVIFADGDRDNMNIDNLILVEKRDVIYMNTKKYFTKGNSELTKTGANISKLHFAIKDLEEGGNK